MARFKHRKINLACGNVFVSGDGWENLDYSARGAAVQQADLLGRLPLSDHCAALVYSSHFLEHVPRDMVIGFLEECYRVLEPNGVIRLVLPDLEELCKAYLHYRKLGEHKKADFVVIQIIDQCVRRAPGGELGRIYRELRSSCSSDSQFLEFIRNRNGDLLAGRDPVLEDVERAGRALVALRAGPFGSADEARALCDAMRSRDEDCIPLGAP